MPSGSTVANHPPKLCDEHEPPSESSSQIGNCITYWIDPWLSLGQ
ncbi:hypothetical protein PpBr36_08675 [Pyricularia pennisetigena]|nr:hypothetical protein PpBr36_08675 [Pyricularia pennisetigena]TLS24256.1 hypothetical protein PpBr36_08675 [Pyricularia pennisetigena]